MSTRDVAAVLGKVYDPDLGLDIVSLGLVYRVAVGSSEISVALTMTSPQCPMAAAIVDAANDVLSSAFPGYVVNVEVVFEPAWNPEMMSAAARHTLGLR